MKLTPSTRAARVTLIYLVFGSLWIIGTDRFLDGLGLGVARLSELQTLKGAVFVLVTGLVFFYLARGELTRQYRADAEAGHRERVLHALFEATFEHAAVGMTHITPDGRYLRVNQAYCELVGYPRDELLAMKFQDITHPDDVELDEAQTLRLEDGDDASFTMDKRFIRGDGSIVWATITSSLVPDPESGADRLLSVVIDISDRKKAEEALRASESRFRALVEQSITGVYVFDQDAFRYVNQRLASMFGYTEDELVGRLGPVDLIAPEDHGTVKAQMERRFTGRVESAHYTARGLRKDGSRIWVELHGSRMEYEGRPAITGTALDITERVDAEKSLRESEARFRAIYDGVNDAILIIDPRDGSIVDLNQRAEEMMGYSADEARRLGMSDLSAGDPGAAQAAAAEWIQAAARGEPQMFEWQAKNRAGESFWVEINMRTAHIDGVEKILVLARDISERRASEEKLRLTNQVFTSTREGVVITDMNGRIVSINPAFSEITGYGESEVLGRTPRILQSGFHDRSFYQAMWQSISKTDHWQGEIWNRRKSGENYPEWLTISAVRDERGAVTNYVGVFTDVSRLKHSEAEVQRLVHYDPLTGFPNRMLLMSRLEHALELYHGSGIPIAVMFCGLDRFKSINESMGYPAGDELLQAVSRRIESRLGSGDTLARFGGDEFVVLTESSREPEEIAQLARTIIGLSDVPVELSTGDSVLAGISVGISLSPEDGNDAAALVTNANAAMQQAKTEGRRTYRFYKHSLTEAARERFNMESRLRQAVENQSLEIYFQPVVDAASGRIIGAEALCRWQDPELGRVAPERFIPLAEDRGLIVPLGRWVLEAACRQTLRWQSAGLDGLTIAVNVSSRQIEPGSLERDLALILDQTGLDPAWLELEITESVLMEHGERSVAILDALRQTGVGISIDDFGTGYSSLAYLKRFSITKFKIDGIFIKELPGNRDDAELVSTMIGMAHNLNLRVVAECVETPEQLAYLKDQGCDEFQGYLISPPVPAPDFEALVRAERGLPAG